MAIFMVQGIIVGIFGTLLGAALGVFISLNFNRLTAFMQATLAPSDLYVISSLPAQLHGMDVLVVCGSALLISFIATLYPAYKASRIHPAEVLRYE